MKQKIPLCLEYPDVSYFELIEKFVSGLPKTIEIIGTESDSDIMKIEYSELLFKVIPPNQLNHIIEKSKVLIQSHIELQNNRGSFSIRLGEKGLLITIENSNVEDGLKSFDAFIQIIKHK